MNQIHIRNQLEQLQREKQALPLPSLAQMEAEIQFHSARVHSIDQATANHHQRALQDALNAKDQAEAAWKRVGEINSEISMLTSQLQMAELEEKRHQVNAADQRMADAHQDFYHAAKLVVQAYRKCMHVGRANAAIPGSSIKLPPGFHFEHLTSQYETPGFTTSQRMAFGPLRLEQDDEKEK